jgi:DNA invertase Pin-like site-specific DNA recombinase
VIVWAVDRICRQGIEELLKLIRELRERHVSLVSVQEPWLSGSDATTELLAAIAGWVAHQESARRSERIKAWRAGAQRASLSAAGSRAARTAGRAGPRATRRPGSAAGLASGRMGASCRSRYGA